VKSTYFSKDFLDFFKELAANNHKDWFDSNRKRYEKNVKDPFKVFVTDLIAEMHKIDPDINIDAKDAIFRINRDIRFSKDKSPYKLDRSAIISSAGRKDHSVPGFYISLGPDKTHLGGGAYFLKPEQLQALRTYIMANNEKLMKVLNNKDFKEYFGEIRGDKNKRLPVEFRDMAESQPLLYNKQFYFMADAPAGWVTKPDLMDRCLEYFKAARPLQRLLVEAVT
jgi:uncharacterized protein (TIGR02453 family)